MFNFVKKLLGYPTDAEKAQASAQVTSVPLVHLGPEPVVETAPAIEIAAPVVAEKPVKAVPAKKKPAVKPAVVKQPAKKKPPVAAPAVRKPRKPKAV